jgi:tRNA-2-methylthio-N6-dimethylallyladenosine synthase
MENVLSEIRSLVQEGYREITLLGQNVNSYGKDLDDGSSFAALIREMGKIEGNYWVRFMTSHPKDLSEEVVLAIRDNRNIS